MSVRYSNGKVTWLRGPFKYRTFWTINRLFFSPVSDHHLNTGLFDNQTQFCHSNTRLVRYSNGYCNRLWIVYFLFFGFDCWCWCWCWCVTLVPSKLRNSSSKRIESCTFISSGIMGGKSGFSLSWEMKGNFKSGAKILGQEFVNILNVLTCTCRGACTYVTSFL